VKPRHLLRQRGSFEVPNSRPNLMLPTSAGYAHFINDEYLVIAKIVRKTVDDYREHLQLLNNVYFLL
jgi:hypothetical protein